MSQPFVFVLGGFDYTTPTMGIERDLNVHLSIGLRGLLNPSLFSHFEREYYPHLCPKIERTCPRSETRPTREPTALLRTTAQSFYDAQRPLPVSVVNGRASTRNVGVRVGGRGALTVVCESGTSERRKLCINI